MNNEKKFNFVHKKCSINNGDSSNTKKIRNETIDNKVDNNINNSKNNKTSNHNINNNSKSFNDLMKDLPKIVMPPSLTHPLLSIANTLPINNNKNISPNTNNNVIQRNTPPFQSPLQFLSLNERLLQLNKSISNSSNLQRIHSNLSAIKNKLQEINSNTPTPPSPSSILNRKTSRFERDFSNSALFRDILTPPLSSSLDKNLYIPKSQGLSPSTLSPFGGITSYLNSPYLHNISASNILNNNDYSLMTPSPLNVINTKDYISQK